MRLTTVQRWTICGSAILTAGTASASGNALTERECARIRAWVTSVPPGIQQIDGLLSPAVFQRSFGKAYEQLTMLELRELQSSTSHCKRVGNMTQVELGTARELLSERAQERWISSPRAPVVATSTAAGTGTAAATTTAVAIPLPPTAAGQQPMTVAPPVAQGETPAPATSGAEPDGKSRWNKLRDRLRGKPGAETTPAVAATPPESPLPPAVAPAPAPAMAAAVVPTATPTPTPAPAPAPAPAAAVAVQTNVVRPATPAAPPPTAAAAAAPSTSLVTTVAPKPVAAAALLPVTPTTVAATPAAAKPSGKVAAPAMAATPPAQLPASAPAQPSRKEAARARVSPPAKDAKDAKATEGAKK